MNELYQSLPRAVRDELSQLEDQAIVPAGTKLIREGITPEHLIAVEKGSVEISMLSGQKIISLSVAGEGKVLGLRAIVAGAPPEIEARTLEECRIAFIRRQDFLQVLTQHPEMYFAIAKVLSTDLDAAQRFLRDAPRFARREKQEPNSMIC
jgi:CRP-like cAMP-binding protein